MSDEEKKAIAYLKFYIERDVMYEDTHYEQIKTILNLIEKQSKEIEELKDKDKEHKQRITYLENKIYNQKQTIKNGINVKKLDVNSLCKNFNLISKDKIKAKIEEYKKQVEKMEKDDIGVGFTLGKEWSDLKAKIEFGQSLLEKE